MPGNFSASSYDISAAEILCTVVSRWSFYMSRISDEVSIWPTRPFPCVVIFRDTVEPCWPNQNTVRPEPVSFMLHMRKWKQHFSWIACLSNADPHVMILLHTDHKNKSRIRDRGRHLCPCHHIQTDSGTWPVCTRGKVAREWRRSCGMLPLFRYVPL